jgi:hypothetical protein
MPYAVPLTHFRAAGHFGSSAVLPLETWTFGFYIGGAALPAGYLLSLPAAYNAVRDYIGGVDAAGFSNEVWLTEVAAAALNADGTLQTGFYSRFFGTPKAGGVQSAAGEFDTTWAITLDAGLPSAGRFNRFYPPPQRPIITLGSITATDATLLATRAKSMLEGVNTAMSASPGAGTTGGIVVASQRWGTNRSLAAIKCGRVPDSQRRRRRSLQENYASIAP